MYRKNEFFDCKNRANGWVGSGLVEGLFVHMLNKLNKNAQVLDFQRFALFSKSFSIHLASF